MTQKTKTDGKTSQINGEVVLNENARFWGRKGRLGFIPEKQREVEDDN